MKDLNSQYENMSCFEDKYKLKGYKFICGCDEAGRGPVAGPIFAAAVILDDDNHILGLDDSKKLSPKKRDYLYEEIIKKAKSWSVYSVSAYEIDRDGIAAANYRAMTEAVKGLDIPADFALIDYHKLDNLDVPHESITKGDSKSVSIAAASIIAKVSRDRYMIEVSKKYPEYDFEKHKGYGTAAHRKNIEKYGMTPEHRKSFLKKWFDI